MSYPLSSSISSEAQPSWFLSAGGSRSSRAGRGEACLHSISKRRREGLGLGAWTAAITPRLCHLHPVGVL